MHYIRTLADFYQQQMEVLMTLDKVRRGEKVQIVHINDSAVRAQAIRLGISEGSKMLCSEKLPAGPVILQNRTQEVAVGRKLAQKILIERVD
jgi:ferrous iron transport protein A